MTAYLPEQVFLAIEPVDVRKGADSLSIIVRESLGQSPCSGSAFAFRNKAGTRIKMLIWDGNGVWLCLRRLHKGRFPWPEFGAQIHPLSQDEWQWLTQGVDWRRIHAKPQESWLI